MRPPRHDRRFDEVRKAAANGLLDRRAFLSGSTGALATGAFMAFAPGKAGAAGPPETPAEMKVSGAPLSAYGSPATFEREVARTLIRSQPGTTGAGASRSPLEALEGRHHAERATLRASPQRRARDRSGAAPAPDPRNGRAHADLLDGVAAALPDGVPHPLPGVLRQQRGDVWGDSAHAHVRADARSRVLQRVDGRSAAAPARRGWSRFPGRLDPCGRGGRGEQDVMNADTLPKVKMPNRDNFILVHPWESRVP
jgi:hypothetical protein